MAGVGLTFHHELRALTRSVRLDTHARYIAVFEPALEARPRTHHDPRLVGSLDGKSRPPASLGAIACSGRQPSREASQAMSRSACEGLLSRPSMSTAYPTRTPVILSRKGRHAGTSKNDVTHSRHGVRRVQLRSVTPKRPRAFSQTSAGSRS